MKKLFFIFLCLLQLVLLSACKEDEVEIIENEYSVTDIEFEKKFGHPNKVYVNTTEETLVIALQNVDFVKATDDKFRVLIQKTSATIFTPKKEISSISKMYAKEFGSTMKFSE